MAKTTYDLTNGERTAEPLPRETEILTEPPAATTTVGARVLDVGRRSPDGDAAQRLERIERGLRVLGEALKSSHLELSATIGAARDEVVAEVRAARAAVVSAVEQLTATVDAAVGASLADLHGQIDRTRLAAVEDVRRTMMDAVAPVAEALAQLDAVVPDGGVELFGPTTAAEEVADEAATRGEGDPAQEELRKELWGEPA